MTKYAAIQQFFGSFGIDAFPELSVPTSGDNMPNFPYLTYALSTGSDQDKVLLTANLWYRSESWVAINAMTDQISQAVGTAKLLVCDDGGMLIRKSTPFAQPLGDDSDNMIKRKYISFEITFMTTK